MSAFPVPDGGRSESKSVNLQLVSNSTHTAMPYKYFAFISYNSADTRWGRRLQRKLEHYRMPATLCRQRGWKRRTPISPVFFAPTDIQPGELSAELKARLEASHHLIVVCSPRSAQSAWVGREIEYFASLGRPECIHFFIVDGTPHSGDASTECFNPAVERAGLGDVLGANVHERVSRWPWVNRERAYVQIVTKLLGVEFDSLWQRHRRRLRMKMTTWAAGIVALVAAFAATLALTAPFDAAITLADDSGATALPPLREAVVRMEGADGQLIRTDTMHTGGRLAFRDLPHRLMGRDVRIISLAPDFLPLDTVLTLTSDVRLTLHRDATAYGHIRFRLLRADAMPWAGQTLTIAGTQVRSAADGTVQLEVPLPQQRVRYAVSSSVPLEQDTLYMPLSDDAVLLAR